MTYIPGIEGLHSWTPPGAGAPAITLGEGVYKLRGIVGLGSLGDVEENADAIVGGIGENLRLDQRRGKTVVYEGRIDADSLLELREAESALRAAFADRSALGRMDLAAHPDNPELAGQTPKFFEAKPMNCDIADQQATKRWSRNFVIGVRMGDPRVFDEETEVHTTAVSHTNEPKVIPGLDYTKDSRLPVLEIATPAFTNSVKVVVLNKTTGKQLALNLTGFWPATQLVLDWERRTIVDETGADRSALMSPLENALWLSQPLSQSEINEVEVFVERIDQTNILLPSKVESVEPAEAGALTWTNPENAHSGVDGKSATVAFPASSKASYLLQASGFFALIPSGAVILSAKASITKSASVKPNTLVGRIVPGWAAGNVADAVAWTTAGVTSVIDLTASLTEAGKLTPEFLNEIKIQYQAENVAGAGLVAVTAAVDSIRLSVIYKRAQAYAATVTVRWRQGYY